VAQAVEELLRRLALNDEETVRTVLTPPGATDQPVPPRLDPGTEALVRLGALLAVGGTTASCRLSVEQARAGGASDPEIVGVLVAVGPAIGLARVVAAAPRLALALDAELDDVPEL
jgi:alkylhydroperoxidase/carboxymuconolactone decarboxylase family protein YurZ